ncbi:MAG: hypothetical protein ACUZ8E_07915 [Candidatus Anammoxibacter sp.]
MNNVKSFSKKWMVISMVIFIATEIILGVLIGKFIVGRYVSTSLSFLVQGLLNIASYFVGGFIIGLVSPGLRIYEPAAGAFLSVAVMFCISFFTPYHFFHFSMIKVIIGGGIAFCLALAGARLGEKLTGNRVA